MTQKTKSILLIMLNQMRYPRLRESGGMSADLCPGASGSGELMTSADLPVGSGLDFVQQGTLPISLPSTFLVQSQLSVSGDAPDHVFDPDISNNVDADLNAVDVIFADGFEFKPGRVRNRLRSAPSPPQSRRSAITSTESPDGEHLP